MATITVHLHTVLQRQGPEGPVRRLEVELPPDATVATLLHQLEIDYPEPLLVVVNGRQAKQDRVLRYGDELHLVPPISGG
jgi:sulfur carrier protein ThiS